MKRSGFKMKYNKSSFPYKTDLTKKTGLGPRAKQKPIDYTVSSSLAETLHDKHAEITYKKDHPYEDEMDRDEPVGVTPKMKSIGASSQIASKMKKSKKKKY